MEAQFERVTGYKWWALGPARNGSGRAPLPLGNSPAGELGRCPRLAGTPPPEGPMMPPPFPPVTAAASPATVTPAAPAAASTGGPASDSGDLHTGYRSKTPTGRGRTTPIKVSASKRDAAAAGVQGAARDTGGAGDSSDRSGRATSQEPRTARSRSKKRRRSQSRKRDSRPTAPFPLQDHKGRLQALQRYMRRPVNINWPLK